MGKNRGPGGPPGPSKYAVKRQAIDRGERNPFQFVDRPKTAPNHRSHPERTVVVAPPSSLVTNGARQVIKATVTFIRPHVRALFLKMEDGRDVYLSMDVISRDYGTDIGLGDMVEGEVNPRAPGRYPAITRILSVTTPAA